MSYFPLSQPPIELCSWKEIAAYLGVSVKTAQLWEHDRGLPIRRFPGPRVQVRVLVSELEVWKQTSTLTSPPIPNISKDVSVVPELVSPAKVAETKPATGRGIRHALLAAVCAMAILFVGQFDAMFGRSNLTSVRVESETLLGLDAKARVLWRNPVPGVDASRYLDGERHLWVGALSGDEPAVLFVPIPTGVTQESVPLICLDKHGRELWKFNPGKSVRGRNSFSPPFIVRQFVVVGGKIVVTSQTPPAKRVA